MAVSISEECFDLLKTDRAVARRARVSRAVRVALWGGLLAFGLQRRGALGLVAMALSVERLYRMFEPDARECLQGLRRPGQLRASTPRELNREWDRVDQAAWESFPASDPPGHS